MDSARRLTTARYSGTLTADPGFRPDFDHLADLLSVERVEIESGQLTTLAMGSPFGKGSRVALVAPKGVVYGLARVFEMGAGVSVAEITVFRHMDEACAWLGVT